MKCAFTKSRFSHMKKIYCLVVSACLLSLTGPGCANFASFQEPDTVAKGQLRSGVGVTLTRYDLDAENSVTIPALNGWGRYGIMDNLEVHTLVWLPLGATIGAKYQLLGNRETAGLSVAVGLDLGYLTITSGEEPNEISSTYLDTYVPVYVGYRVSPAFSVYAVPKYLLRVVSGNEADTTASHNFGGALGIALGRSRTLHLEGVMLYGDGSSLFTTGIGVAF
jgi:hypothetical protein